MKILYLFNNSSDNFEVSSLQVRSMCKAMANLGHEVILSLPKPRDSKSSDVENVDGYRIIGRSSHNNKLKKYTTGKRIIHTALNVKPDLIYVRDPLLLWQVRKLRYPIILELHSRVLHQGLKILDAYWRRFIIRLSKQGRIKRIVCISKALSNYWISEGIPKNLVQTFHDGVDEELYDIELSKNTIRENLGLPQDKIIACYSGNLYPNRHIEVIIPLAKEFPDLLFIVVGGLASQADKYRSLALLHDVNNIIFTGHVDYRLVSQYLLSSDILLALFSKNIPTIGDCSPLKVFEYMAAGKTIVAHSFPTIKEVLRDGENAILVEPESHESLVTGLQKALAVLDDHSIGYRAREDVLSRYTWQKRAEGILKGI